MTNKKTIIQADEGFFIKKDKLMISSIQVAEAFNKQHGNILNLIRRLVENEPKLKRNFHEEIYTSKNNNKKPIFLMNKKGFDIATSKYQTATDFIAKAKFIENFLQREAEQKIKVLQKDFNLKDKTEEAPVETIITTPVTVIEGTIVVPNNTIPTVKSNFTLEEVEEVVKEYAKTNPVELAIIPYDQKQHNNIHLPVIEMNHNEPLVIDSRDVAEMIGKRHDNLVRDIKRYVEVIDQSSNLRTANFFIESSYKNENNQTYTCYLLTRKGCDMVANKMTGDKGILFTATYVTRFEEMEEQLKLQEVANVPSYMINDKIQRATAWIAEQQEKLLLEEIVETQVAVIEQKDRVIEEQAEKIEYVEDIVQKYKEEMTQAISHKFEIAHIQSKGLSIDEMIAHIKYMVKKDSFNGQSSWNKLYDSYNAKYNVNISSMKSRYEKDNFSPPIYIIDFVAKDFILTSQMYETAKEVFGHK